MSKRTLKTKVLNMLLYVIRNRRELSFDDAVDTTVNIFSVGHPQITKIWVENLCYDLKESIDDNQFNNYLSVHIY